MQVVKFEVHVHSLSIFFSQQHQYPILQIALMESYDLEVVQPVFDEAEWRCAMRDSGGPYVTISGGPMMLKWHADSLDLLHMVFLISGTIS